MMLRETRYSVIKITDGLAYLTHEQCNKLDELLGIVAAGRARDGKRPLKCVIVEDDWPEYEQVWQLIEDRVEGGVNYE
jgi:hypothetical protein